MSVKKTIFFDETIPHLHIYQNVMTGDVYFEDDKREIELRLCSEAEWDLLKNTEISPLGNIGLNV